MGETVNNEPLPNIETVETMAKKRRMRLQWLGHIRSKECLQEWLQGAYPGHYWHADGSGQANTSESRVPMCVCVCVCVRACACVCVCVLLMLLCGGCFRGIIGICL